MLSNSQALDLYVASFNQFSHNDISGVINTEFKVVAVTDAAIKLYSLNSLEEVIGKNYLTDMVVVLDRKNSADLLNRVIDNKTEIKTISINFIRPPTHDLMLVDYLPLINKDTLDVVGVHIKAYSLEHPLSWFKINQLMDNISKPNSVELTAMSDKLLNIIEHEILFLLFYYDNYAKIAEILNYRHGTNFSKDYIGQKIRRNLFIKFDVYNLDELKEKVLALNYHRYPPTSLIGETIIELRKL
jgi:hypothetical protein